jgi:hypothetical protein
MQHFSEICVMDNIFYQREKTSLSFPLKQLLLIPKKDTSLVYPIGEGFQWWAHFTCYSLRELYYLIFDWDPLQLWINRNIV